MLTRNYQLVMRDLASIEENWKSKSEDCLNLNFNCFLVILPSKHPPYRNFNVQGRYYLRMDPFIHSLIKRHLGSFHVLSFTNNGVMIITEQSSCGLIVPLLGICPKVILLGLEVYWLPIFWEFTKLISTVTEQVCTPTSNRKEFQLLHIHSSINTH